MRRLGERAVPSDVDILDADGLREAIRAEAPAAVAHLAATASVAQSWNKGADAWQVNAVGTVNLLDARGNRGPRALVCSSSRPARSTASPTACRPARTRPPRRFPPTVPRRSARRLACRRARRADRLDVVVARSFPHVGPGQDERFAVGSWVLQIALAELAGGGVLQVGDLTRSPRLGRRRDVARAYEAAARPGRSGRHLQRRFGPCPGAARGGRAARRARHAARSRSSRITGRLRPADIPMIVRRRQPAGGRDRVVAGDPARADPRRRARRGEARGSDGGDGRRMSRRALITGITGQDGSYLAELLLDEGYEVFGMVRRASTENFERISHLVDRITLVQADLLDELSLMSALRRHRAERGLQPGGAELRPDVVEPAGPDGRVHRGRRDADPRGHPRSQPRDPVLPGLLVGDVRQGAGDPAERADAVLSRGRRTAWRRSTGTSSPSTTASPTASSPLRGILFNHESPAAWARVRDPEDHGRRRTDQAGAR